MKMSKFLFAASVAAIVAGYASSAEAQPGGVTHTIQPVVKGHCAVFNESNQTDIVDVGPCSGTGGGVSSFNTRTGDITLSSSDVNTALSYTAANDSLVLKKASNLSDVATPATALTNIGGIGAATTNTLTNKAYDTAGTGNVFKINGTTVSSLSGNTSEVASVSGALTTGDGIKPDASGNFVDAGFAYASIGSGVVATTSQSPTVTEFNVNCKQITINNSGLNIGLPAVAGGPNTAGCFDIINATANTYTITPAGTTNLNGANATITEQGNTFVRVTSDASNWFANKPSASGGLTNGVTTYTSPAAATSVLFVASGVISTSSAFTSDTSGNVSVASITTTVGGGTFADNVAILNNSGVFELRGGNTRIGSGADGRLQNVDGSGVTHWQTDKNGNVAYFGTIPTVTGTGTPTIRTGSTNTGGEVTAGASATSVVITFNQTVAIAVAPFCVVTPNTHNSSFDFAVTNTAITVTQTAAAEKISWHCDQAA